MGCKYLDHGRSKQSQQPKPVSWDSTRAVRGTTHNAAGRFHSDLKRVSGGGVTMPRAGKTALGVGNRSRCSTSRCMWSEVGHAEYLNYVG